MTRRTEEQNAAIIRAIRSSNTKPELAVRRIVRAFGYGYRLNRKEIPGTPDLAFIGRRKAIFVHGCFWHQHNDPTCKLSKLPKSRTDYWGPKLARNIARDERVATELEQRGWATLIIWECNLKDRSEVADRIAQFLADDHARSK